MVKNIAIIKNNVVENVIVFDDESGWSNPPGAEMVDVTDVFVAPGFIRNDDGTFSPPPEAAE